MNEDADKRMKEMIQKYNLGIYLEKEEKWEKSKKSRSMERTNYLYEKGKIKYKMNKFLKVKKEEHKLQEELNKCTWRPKLNKLNSKMEQKLNTLINDTRVYNRKLKYTSKTIENYIKSKDKEVYQHTFNPAVKYKYYLIISNIA